MTRQVFYNTDSDGNTGPLMAHGGYNDTTRYSRRWSQKSAGPYKREQPSKTDTSTGGVREVSQNKETEKRIDPDDGQAHTFSELRQYYSAEFSLHEIKAYWDKVCKPVSSVGAEKPVSSAGAEKDLESFVEKLRAHCNDDSLIKGWEAGRRICNGRDRAALRAAAKEVRQKAFKTNKTTQIQANVSRALSRQEWLFVEALQQLHSELAKAQESDFDCMLKDGLEWLEERLGFKEKNIKCVTASVYDRVGHDLLRRLQTQRASGHRGKAIDRDLRYATVLHGKVCEAWAALDGAEESQFSYLRVVEEFMVELAKAGEPDFDGKLRQAINFLEHGGARLEY